MNRKAANVAAAFGAGALFGLGLSVGGMLDPARVQGFLDVFGAWNPALAFVLAGAVVVAFAGVRIARRMGHPIFAERFSWPASNAIDMRLIAGSAIFGVGWGLGGLCPGPAVAALSLGLMPVFVFVTAMVAGMIVHDRLVAPRAVRTPPPVLRTTSPVNGGG